MSYSPAGPGTFRHTGNGDHAARQGWRSERSGEGSGLQGCSHVERTVRRVTLEHKVVEN